MRKTNLTLSVLKGHYSVCRLDRTAELPSWLPHEGFTSITRTSEELSIVCQKEVVPDWIAAEHGFSALKIEGPLEFSLTGILSSVSAPLADAEIPIFAISTFDTDYILVKTHHCSKAVSVLENQGHTVNTVLWG